MLRFKTIDNVTKKCKWAKCRLCGADMLARISVIGDDCEVSLYCHKCNLSDNFDVPDWSLYNNFYSLVDSVKESFSLLPIMKGLLRNEE